MNCSDQFHDACGMEIQAHLRGKSGHLLREATIQALTRLMHRALLLRSQ